MVRLWKKQMSVLVFAIIFIQVYMTGQLPLSYAGLRIGNIGFYTGTRPVCDVSASMHTLELPRLWQIMIKYVLTYLFTLYMTINVIWSFDVKKINTHQTFI